MTADTNWGVTPAYNTQHRFVSEFEGDSAKPIRVIAQVYHPEDAPILAAAREMLDVLTRERDALKASARRALEHINKVPAGLLERLARVEAAINKAEGRA